jgi:Uma2 family endonuclease
MTRGFPCPILASVLQPETSSVPCSLTEEEWGALDEDTEGELVDGRLVEEEGPDFAHEVVVFWLAALFSRWIDVHGGIAGVSDAKFIVARARGRKPDLSLYLPGSARPPRRGVVRVPPDVMVEVVSRSPKDVRRDRIEKMDEYARFGVRWYWLVDPFARTFEIYERNADGAYVRSVGAAQGRVERVPGFEGMAVDLDALWAKIDELPDEDEPAEG